MLGPTALALWVPVGATDQLFLALEEPVDSPFMVPFAKRERFADNRYLLRFGFIGAKKSPRNPDGLPIGFAISPYQIIDGLSRKETAVGMTCAACHTGQLVFKGKRYIVEGGPAATDLGQLTEALAAALGQTALSEKLPFLDGRFDRFARAVLQAEYTDITRNRLADELDAVVKALAAQPNGVAVTEGFTRLDALNRIGNQVFAVDTKRYGNAVDVNAPVNYPHIWTASWFSWVQYDGSIMQPPGAFNWLNLLSSVHDARNARSPEGAAGSVPSPLPNPKAKGNVSFVDGHAEQVTRRYAHATKHTFPKPSVAIQPDP